MYLEKAELHNSKPAKHYQDREPAKSNKSLSKRMKQLHISYHNGDHYNSVRRIGDFGISGGGAANKPANVYIDVSKFFNIKVESLQSSILITTYEILKAIKILFFADIET